MTDSYRVGLMNETDHETLPALEDKLAAVLGDDLADSLIRAAMTRGTWGLDMQLAVNDGLAALDAERKERAISLIDKLLAEGRARLRDAGH